MQDTPREGRRSTVRVRRSPGERTERRAERRTGRRADRRADRRTGLRARRRTDRAPRPRPLSVAHAGEMAEVLADPALHAFIGGAPLSPPELRARYERLAAGSPDPAVTWLNWVVRLRSEDRLTGTVQATLTDGGRVAEVAWVVGTAWQGRGSRARRPGPGRTARGPGRADRRRPRPSRPRGLRRRRPRGWPRPHRPGGGRRGALGAAGGLGVSRRSCRARGVWHRTSPRCRHSPWLRHASLLRLARHGTGHRSLIRPDRRDTPRTRPARAWTACVRVPGGGDRPGGLCWSCTEEESSSPSARWRAPP